MGFEKIKVIVIAICSFGCAYASVPSQVLQETVETHEIVEHLKVYQVFHDGAPISMKRIGRAYDGGYVIPEIAIQAADTVMGYGISNDISFEDMAATLYDKSSFGFDGTVVKVHPKNPNCQFISSNIVSHSAALDVFQGKDGLHPFKKPTSFDQQLEILGLRGLPLFIKMDIEGSEYETMPDLLRHAGDITGIVLEIHFGEDAQIPKALSLLRQLDRDFLLIHVHGNNCMSSCIETSNCIGYIPRVLELTYIHKNLVDHYELSLNQSHPTPLDMPNHKDLPDAQFTVFVDR